MAYLRFRTVDLPIPPPELEEWVRDHIDIRDIFPQLDNQGNISALRRLPVHPDTWKYPTEVRLNVVHWPAWGRSRFMMFHTIVTKEIYDEIVAALPTSSGPPQHRLLSGPLAMSSGPDGEEDFSVNAVNFPCIVVDCRALTGYDDNLLLLTLSDVRHYWNCINRGLTSQGYYTSQYLLISQTWGTLLNSGDISSGASSIGFVPALPSIYSKSYPGTATTPWTITPHPDRWAGKPGVRNVPQPVLSDAAAKAINRRIVYTLSFGFGSTTIQAHGWEKAYEDNEWNFSNSEFNKRLIAGGRTDPQKMFGQLPTRITVRFDDMLAEGGVGPTGSGPSVSRFFKFRGVEDLGISQFAGWTPAPFGSESFREAYLSAELLPVYSGSTLTNEADMEEYATQAAKDYIGWFLADADATWAGTIPLRINGFQEFVEWHYKGDRSFTKQVRAVRPSVNQQSDFYHASLPTLRTRWWGSTSISGDTFQANIQLTPVELPRGYWRISVSGWTTFGHGDRAVAGGSVTFQDSANAYLSFNRQITMGGDIPIGSIRMWTESTVFPTDWVLRSGGPLIQPWSCVGVIAVSEDNFSLTPTLKLFRGASSASRVSHLTVNHITLTALRVDWGYLQRTYGVWGATWGGGGAGGGGGKAIDLPMEQAMANEFVMDDIAVVDGMGNWNRDLLRRATATNIVIP